MSHREDTELVQGALERSITEEEFEHLEERLVQEPVLRKLYYKYSVLQHTLIEQHEGVLALPDRFRALERAPISRRMIVTTSLATAAIMMVMAVAAYFITIKQPPLSARVTFGPMSAGQLEQGQVGARGTTMEIGSRLTLDRGTAEIMLPSGVRALVEGPAVIEATGENAVLLPEGRAWFEVPRGAEGFSCRTRSLEVVDLGTRFGVISGPEGHNEVFVEQGRIRLWPLKRPEEAIELRTGEGMVWNGVRFEAATPGTRFLSQLPEEELVFREDFSDDDETLLRGKLPAVGDGPWEVPLGNPSIFDNRLDTSGAPVEAFAPLPEGMLSPDNHVLIVSAEVLDPDSRLFHSDGWAGISLFTGDQERVFMGDPFGPGVSWALHPHGSNVVMPSPPLRDKRVVTLRYDFRTGLAELFEGWNCYDQALASEWIPAGLQFDRLRVANGEGGDIALKRLEVKVLKSIGK